MWTAVIDHSRRNRHGSFDDPSGERRGLRRCRGSRSGRVACDGKALCCSRWLPSWTGESSATSSSAGCRLKRAAGAIAAVALAPLAVLPRYQRQGIGGKLIRDGVDASARSGRAVRDRGRSPDVLSALRLLDRADAFARKPFPARRVHGAPAEAWCARSDSGPGQIPTRVWTLTGSSCLSGELHERRDPFTGRAEPLRCRWRTVARWRSGPRAGRVRRPSSGRTWRAARAPTCPIRP